MASSNEEFWTIENINFLIDRRIARNAIFNTNHADKIGWLQILTDLKKIGAPKSLNRIHVRRQWFKICEIYKKHVENNEVYEKIVQDFPYYKKLDKFFAQNTSNSKESKFDNIKKKIPSRFLEVTHYADRWPDHRTELLIESRISRNAMFAGRGFSGKAWEAVLEDLRRAGGPESLTSYQVKRKWENLCTRYKLLKEKGLYDTKWKYFYKIHEFLESCKNKKLPDDESLENIENISNDTITGETRNTLEINAENLPTSDKLQETNLELDQSSNKMEEASYKYRLSMYADRWPVERTAHLVQSRIAKDDMFDGRGMSTSGWQAVLSDLIKGGAPETITLRQVKKKWEYLCARYKVIKDSNIDNTNWPYFKQIHNYMKKRRARKMISLSQSTERVLPESCELFDLKLVEQKTDENLSNCRLCQQMRGEHSLMEDTDLCNRIEQCTAMKVLEGIDGLPTSVCKKCKTLIDSFYEFLIKCREVDKTLRANMTAINIKSETTEIETSEKQGVLECSECPASLNSTEALDKHIKSHKNGRFYCEFCSSTFSRQSALFSHIKRHFEETSVSLNETSNTNDEEYLANTKGDTCDEEFVDNFSPVLNTNEGEDTQDVPDDSKKKIFSCELCSKSYSQPSALRYHLESHSGNIHACPREGCNKTYATMNSLRNHERKHLGLHSFLCMVCGKGFVTKNALQLHEKTHSEVKEFSCGICNRGFTVMSNLRAHQRKHHEGHRFYCSQCPKQFLTKCSLHRHELVHTGIKGFLCHTCNSAFYTNKELLKHQRYHQGIRLHHCNVCFKTFFEKHHLTVHMRSHTGEKPYACSVPDCGKTFRESQKLSRHVKTHHRLHT